MLTLTNSLLEGDIIITEAETIISLSAEKECVYQGVLRFSDGSEASFDFTKYSDVYKTRIVLSENDLARIENAYFFVFIADGSMTEKTNMLKVFADVNKIKVHSTKSRQDEISKLRDKVQTLESQIQKLVSQGTITKIKLSGNCEAGMIPVALDGEGHFIGCYPFADHVSVINGLRPLNGVIELKANDIEYVSNQTVKEAIASHVEAIRALNENTQALSEQITQIANDLALVKMQIESMNNYGIL